MFASDFKIKAGAMEEGVVFGSYIKVDSDGNNLASYVCYQATSDGFVLVSEYGVVYAECGPTTNHNEVSMADGGAGQHVYYGSITMAVKKGYYWCVTTYSGEPSCIV